MINPRIDGVATQGKLLPTIIDELARDDPNGLWMEYPSSLSTFDAGFNQITYAELANSVNGVANCITSALGREDTGEPLAWLAPNSPLCSITLIAAMKAGFKLFLTSERNTVAENHKLFDQVRCSTIITTNAAFPQVRDSLRGRKLSVIVLPWFDQLLHEHQRKYDYDKKLSMSYDETAIIVHTPSFNGGPKPMHLSHGFIAKVARDIGLSPPDGYDTQSSFVANNKCILISPLSDPAGVYFSIFNAIFNNTSTVLPNPEDPPTGKTLVQMLHHTRADWAALPSNTLSGVAKDSAVLDEIASHLELLVITGEPLAKKYGDVIASEVRLIHMPHSSETGLLPTIYRHGYNFKADWNYFQFHPAIGACLVPMSGDVYELIFDRTPETELYLTDFTNSYAFRAKDLYNRHPTMPDIWAPVSGSNVIFSMTGKAKPIEFNKHVCRHPEAPATL